MKTRRRQFDDHSHLKTFVVLFLFFLIVGALTN